MTMQLWQCSLDQYCPFFKIDIVSVVGDAMGGLDSVTSVETLEDGDDWEWPGGSDQVGLKAKSR